MENPDFPQTEAQWAIKQIFNKGSNRIDALLQSELKLSSKISSSLPSVDELKKIKDYVFRIDADTPELRAAVQNQLNNLKAKYADFNFSAIYGGKKIMSVGLFRYNGHIYDNNSEVTLSVNISTEEFYLKYWEKARKELGIKYIQDGADFNKSKLDHVLAELDLLRSWAIKNLAGTELEYMKERIENLQMVIPNAFIDEDTILYIF